MDELLNALRQFDALRDGDIVHQDSLPAIAPTYADVSAFKSARTIMVR